MSDKTKQFQRNIRISPDLWAYVRSQAKGGNCSEVIRKWILDKIADDPTYKPQAVSDM